MSKLLIENIKVKLNKSKNGLKGYTLYFIGLLFIESKYITVAVFGKKQL